MKRTVIILLSALALAGGCAAENEACLSVSHDGGAQVRVDRPEVPSHPAADPQVPPFRRAEPERVAPAETNLAEIKEMAGRPTDIDVFVAWLKTHTNVSNVYHQRKTWLTSNPPQQKVGFTLDGVRHELVLPVDMEVLARTLEAPHDSDGR